jgi:hypothetical protein
MKKPTALFFVLLVAVGIAFFSIVLSRTPGMAYTDMRTILTTTTGTFGSLLGIITAGLMFTHGKYSELSSELGGKLSNYLFSELSLDKTQSIENHLITLRKTYTQLAANATVAEERTMYEKIVAKVSTLLIDVTVLLNLKLKQQGLSEPSVLISEMNSTVYNLYERRRASIRKEWHLFRIIKQIVDTWEPPASLFTNESNIKTALHADLRNSLSILKLRENMDKSLTNARAETGKTIDDLNEKISQISNRFHEDRVPQLLAQMEQAATIRGKYFYLTLAFIAAPLLVNLLVLPQLSEGTVVFFGWVLALTSSLAILGVMFLLLYIHKILNV